MPTDGVPQWSREKQNEVYGEAYGLYLQENYKRAAQIYTTLVYSNPFNIRFWKGLAASEQMQNRSEAALHAWSIVAILDEKDPQPHVHAAECLLQMDQYEEAQKALALAEERDKINEEDTTFQTRINHIKIALAYGTSSNSN